MLSSKEMREAAIKSGIHPERVELCEVLASLFGCSEGERTQKQQKIGSLVAAIESGSAADNLNARSARVADMLAVNTKAASVLGIGKYNKGNAVVTVAVESLGEILPAAQVKSADLVKSASVKL
jgi:hypothetical protein